MTPAEYRAAITRLLLTPAKEPYNGAQIHLDHKRDPYRIPVAEEMNAEEREDFIALLTFRLGLIIH